MKKTKLLASAGALVVLGSAGFLAVPNANGTTITITAGAGSSVSCTITGGAKIATPLMNDWSQAAHASDPGDAAAAPAPVASKDAATYTGNATIEAAMASIPDVTFSAAPAPVTTSAKLAGVCSGTVQDLQGSTGVASGALVSTSVSGGTSRSTCSGLVPDPLNPTTFTSIITWKGTGTTKIAPSTVTSTLGELVSTHGVGFELTATGITGSFAGGTSVADAYIDTTTLGAILGSASTSAAQSGSLCEATLSGKFTPAASGPAAGSSDAIAIKLKKPKGLKAITIGNSGPQGIGTPADSTITLSR